MLLDIATSIPARSRFLLASADVLSLAYLSKRERGVRYLSVLEYGCVRSAILFFLADQRLARLHVCHE